jgi:hypothetical protein
VAFVQQSVGRPAGHIGEELLPECSGRVLALCHAAAAQLGVSVCGRSGVPSNRRCSTIRPSSVTATSSAIALATFISCVTSTIVMPSRRFTSRRQRSTVIVVRGSTALVGSSHSSTVGELASARAMATRCFCPPESFDG